MYPVLPSADTAKSVHTIRRRSPGRRCGSMDRGVTCPRTARGTCAGRGRWLGERRPPRGRSIGSATARRRSRWRPGFRMGSSSRIRTPSRGRPSTSRRPTRSPSRRIDRSIPVTSGRGPCPAGARSGRVVPPCPPRPHTQAAPPSCRRSWPGPHTSGTGLDRDGEARLLPGGCHFRKVADDGRPHELRARRIGHAGRRRRHQVVRT